MKLYLVRHAIAEEPDAASWPDDAARPLTKRGAKRFKQAAEGLVALVPRVDVVLSSPHERAWRTAKILEARGWPEPVAFPELAQSEPNMMIQALQPFAQVESLALIGHEPGLSRLAAAAFGLSLCPWGQLKKGGVACIDVGRLDGNTAGDLVWLLPPGVLRALG